MGSCISKCKCKRKRKNQVEPSHVQDKMVISRAPPPASSLSFSSTNQSLSLHSPTSASSSVSSVSCTTRSTSNSFSLTSSLSSSSSIASSIVSSKDRSFSNEFLYSCVKENPQIIRVDPVRRVVQKSAAVKNYPPDSIQSTQFSTVPQKRARANSPVLSRQKSFRREIETSNYYGNSTPSRNLRSPSPSRRFCGENNYRGELKNRHKDFGCKNSVAAKENVVTAAISSAKRENIRPSSPSNNLGRHRGYLMNRENSVYRISSKVDELPVGEEFSSKRDVDVIPMEDMDNPIIALDCFIFL